MYIDKKMQELDEFFEIHFLYFNGVEMESVKDLNALPNRFEYSLIVKNYLRGLINEHLGFFKEVSRVFIYKFKNGKKTWSKVFSINNQTFFDYVNSRTKQEAKMEQEIDEYQEYCKFLKNLGDR